jgi:hypothetical protein
MGARVDAPTLLPTGRTEDGRAAITLDEFAALLGLSKTTAWHMARSGKVRTIQTKPNGALRITVPSVLALLGEGA